MTIFHQEIMNWDFKRIGKNYALLSIVAVVVAASLSLFLLWPQLSQAATVFAESGGPLGWRLDALEETLEWSFAGVAVGGVSAVSLGVRTLLLVIGLALMALAAGYWLLVALWLHQLAVRSDMNGTLWFLLGLVGNLAAVAVFFVSRSLLRVECDACGGWSPKDAAYCRHCGNVIGYNCPACGQPMNRNDQFCRHCGAVTNSSEDTIIDADDPAAVAKFTADGL